MEEGRHLVREGDFSYELLAIEEGQAEVLRGGEHVADLGPGRLLRRARAARARQAQRHRGGQDADAPDHAHRLGLQAHGARHARGGGTGARGARGAPAGGVGDGRPHRAVRRDRVHRAADGGGDGRARPAARARCAQRRAARATGRRARPGLETATADVSDPASVSALVETGDVLVTTVGPFVRWGAPAAAAAVDRGRALPRLDRRAALHPRGVRALRGRRGAERRGDAHRVRVRLGAGQPRRRARAEPRGRGGGARGHRLLHHRRQPAR